jgi:hypothetical protein
MPLPRDEGQGGAAGIVLPLQLTADSLEDMCVPISLHRTIPTLLQCVHYPSTRRFCSAKPFSPSRHRFIRSRTFPSHISRCPPSTFLLVDRLDFMLVLRLWPGRWTTLRPISGHPNRSLFFHFVSCRKCQWSHRMGPDLTRRLHGSQPSPRYIALPVSVL